MEMIKKHSRNDQENTAVESKPGSPCHGDGPGRENGVSSTRPIFLFLDSNIFFFDVNQKIYFWCVPFEEFSIRRCTQTVLRHLSRLKTNSDIPFHTMLTFLSYATTDVLLYGIYREFFPYYSPLRAKTHGWFLKKTFLGVLDA